MDKAATARAGTARASAADGANAIKAKVTRKERAGPREELTLRAMGRRRSHDPTRRRLSIF